MNEQSEITLNLVYVIKMLSYERARYLKTRIPQQIRCRLSLTWIFFKAMNTEDYVMIVEVDSLNNKEWVS